MNNSSETHREVVNSYLNMSPDLKLSLSHQEYQVIYSIILRLYEELGSLRWIEMTFLSSLDAYWKTKGLESEVAMQYEGLMGSYIRRFAVARQFSRAPSSVVKNYLQENTVNATRYWHNYYDPYPPPNIEKMDEPYRRFFLLLNNLLDQMNARKDSEDAVKFLASLMAAFALTYPITYLAADSSFRGYLKDEVVGEPEDDDYTFYLCRSMDYMLLNRF